MAINKLWPLYLETTDSQHHNVDTTYSVKRRHYVYR